MISREEDCRREIVKIGVFEGDCPKYENDSLKIIKAYKYASGLRSHSDRGFMHSHEKQKYFDLDCGILGKVRDMHFEHHIFKWDRTPFIFHIMTHREYERLRDSMSNMPEIDLNNGHIILIATRIVPEDRYMVEESLYPDYRYCNPRVNKKNIQSINGDASAFEWTIRDMERLFDGPLYKEIYSKYKSL